ncbi:type VI secretion system-associated FHA domain protein TagH [Cupriavidus sp. 2TAF22]|uniref:type VI secretion system-associated FHA domain protein TagH n=1 Tax=unclassified Cupriavidus TaxID=2640874 RepID=UPI003F939231
MNDPAIERRVAMVVTNPQALQQGSTPRHSFGAEGGSIGSGEVNWCLADGARRVRPMHCEILMEDDAFVVVDRSGQTRINNHADPIGMNVGARLSDGDLLRIGPYMVAVHLDDDPAALPDATRHLAQYELGELLNDPGMQLDDLSMPAPALAWEAALVAADDDGLSAFNELSATTQPGEELDPLLALDAAERRRQPQEDCLAPLDPTHYGMSPASTQQDLATTRFEAVSGSPPTQLGDLGMPQQDTRALAAQRWLTSQHADGIDANQLAAPLVQGLDAPVGTLDAKASYTLLLEAGQALGAAIRGLAALHRTQAGEQRRLALHDRTLQPIEDNPLRLGQSYPDTVASLFSANRSVVHLAPAAAIEESLEQLRLQHEAMLQAISVALDALLQSFSPQQLLSRFRRYRPEQAESQPGEWAWQMYTHYYEELTSGRQQGFDKLFWEVFDQAYDKAVRAEAQ